jgi:hypothetical protein
MQMPYKAARAALVLWTYGSWMRALLDMRYQKLLKMA